jgi:hypothetical protein
MAFEGNFDSTQEIGKNAPGPLRLSIMVSGDVNMSGTDTRLCAAANVPAACAAVTTAIPNQAVIANGDPIGEHARVLAWYTAQEGATVLPPIPEPPPLAMEPATVRTNSTKKCDFNNKMELYGSVQCGNISVNNEAAIIGGLYAMGAPRASGCSVNPFLVCINNNAEEVGHIVGIGGGNVVFDNSAQIMGNIWVQGNVDFNNNATIAGTMAVTGNVSFGNNTTVENDPNWGGITSASVVASGAKGIGIVETGW